MLEANLDSLRKMFPAAPFTVVASDPEWVARRYSVDAVPSFGFPRDRAASAERESMRAALLASPDHPTVAALASADALILSGGGNLSSSWPDLLYERIVLLELAHRLAKPSIILGQTLGPHLGESEKPLLVAALRGARFLGVRELASAVLAVHLGIPQERVWYQFDDAMRIDEPLAPPPSEATIAVTIDPQIRATGKALFASLAEQLRELSDATGARLVLVPHAFGGSPSDLTEARLLAEMIGASRVSIAEGLDVEGARRAAANASLIVSSRYHPIVFGLLAGVPSVGIYGDDYCRIKLQGALAHAGLERWALTYDEVASGTLLTASLELWTARASIRNELEVRAASWREECRERWAAVRSALLGERAEISGLFGKPIDAVMPALASMVSAQQQWSESVLASHDARHHEIQMYFQAEMGPRRTFFRYLRAMRKRLGGR